MREEVNCILQKTRKKTISLSSFLGICFIFVAVFPAVLLGFYQAYSSGWALENLEEKDLMRSLRSASTLVENYLSTHENKAKTLASLIGNLPIWYEDDINALLQYYISGDMGFREWRLVNSVGITITSYPTPFAKNDYYRTLWFEKMRVKPEFNIITRISEYQFRKNYIAMVAPILKDNKFAGAIVGYIDLGVLGDLLNDTINYPVVIADDRGYNLYVRNNTKEDTLQLNSLIAKKVDTFTPEWIDEEDGQYLSAYLMLPRWHWHIIVEKPREYIAKHWLDRIVISFLGVGLMIVFVLALLPWLNRLLFDPFYNLHKAFRSSTDKKVLSLMSEDQEIKEFQDIASDFNTMISRLQDMITEMDLNFIASIESLSKTVEFRDKYTGGHSQRVAKYSVLIAKEKGFAAKTIEQIRIAGLLHDIGKIGVPGKILNKPGLLTDKEWEKIKTHPVIAEEILARGPFKDMIPHIRSHHERFDGKGYPDGLKGNEIPVIAQILAVADAFDAMTSSRVYRPQMSVQEAKEELIRNKGTQFAPDIVDVLVQIIDKGIITDQLDNCIS